jgi:hypothetical protein
MEILNVIVAGVAAYAFGAVWYMSLAKPWVAAVGLDVDENGRPVNNSPLPYVIAFVGAIVTAGMMRHVFALSGIDTPVKGLVSGLGIGLFLVTPWIAANYAFGNRPRNLFLIDAGFATGSCTVIGLVLCLF